MDESSQVPLDVEDMRAVIEPLSVKEVKKLLKSWDVDVPCH